MKKNEFINGIENAKAKNAHTRAIKGATNYADGYYAEEIIRLNNNGYKGAKTLIKPSGSKGDTTVIINGKKHTAEIKTGAFEIATLNADRTIKSSIFNNDFLIYCDRIDKNADLFSQMIIVKMDVVKAIIEKYSRIKQSTANIRTYGGTVKEGYGYYDRITLKSAVNNYNYPFDFYIELIDNGAITLKDFYNK